METRRMPVRPSVLMWARESARLDVNEAAHRMGVSVTSLNQWENGDLDPTIIQLRKAASVYTRPLSAFFLTSPLTEEVRFDLPDFRGANVEGRESAALRKAILRARRQRDTIQELAEDGGEIPLSPSGRLEIHQSDTVAESGMKLRAALELDDVGPRVVSKPEELLRTLVRRVEKLGYIVIQVQNVPTEEMRGFSLAGKLMPVIAVNGADWPRGKIFTLLHELVHVATRQSGLCDFSRDSSQPEERFCDEVAAAALMPRELFLKKAKGVDPTSYENLRRLGDNFGVSAESVLVRMVHLELATWSDYANIKPSFRDAYSLHKQHEKEARFNKNAPIYYQLKVRDLGRPFIVTILRAHGDGLLSSRDVTQILEISYDKIPKLTARLSGEVQA